MTSPSRELPEAPLVGREIWVPVMEAAEYRCQCAGSCGRKHMLSDRKCVLHHVKHASGTGHCDVTHSRFYGGNRILIAAPADLSLGWYEAARLKPAELTAWCPDCYGGATRALKREIKKIPLQRDELDLFGGVAS